MAIDEKQGVADEIRHNFGVKKMIEFLAIANFISLSMYTFI